MTGSVLSDHNWRTTDEQQIQDTLNFNRQWLDLIAEVYGYQVISPTTFGPDGNTTGYLPLCAIHGAFGRQRLVAAPFSDSCPLLAQNDATANELVDQAIRLTRQRKARYLELRMGANDALAAHPDLVEHNLYVRHWLPLDEDHDTMWSALRAPVQKRIKKSRRLGVQVRLAQGLDDIDRFYQLHLLTRSKKHGMPAQPRRFFQELWRTFAAQGAMRLLLAEHEGVPVASIILLASGRTFKCLYTASDERYLYLAPVNQLMWTAMTWGGSQGFETLDLGRTARDNLGLMEFKRRLGGIEEPLPYYYYPRVAGLAATAESSWKTRTLTACWKRLPLWLAEPWGGYLYKYLG
jgi:CelD/BcsL family acetyltransferase involved in cellulose biosynthesis